MFHWKDGVSFFIGFFLTVMGLLPLLSKLGIGPSWFAIPSAGLSIFAYVVAAAGMYLLVNSIIEITNSNAIGWFSFFAAAIFFLIGLMQVLFKFGVGYSWFGLSWISPAVYFVIFIIEGVLLMIACFAMEL
ncbi:MAG TPA: hypothetical protein VJI75_06480 [Candidatus Nanoarchaeia archaeon]|nr:hypothetical protein [Candidatus Nanoarchaeia archaeon]